MAKRLYWIKLPKDFFTSPRMKKLRKIAGGDTYTIIYLKLQLLSAENNGLIAYEGIEPTIHEELALVLDEDPENVKVTLTYLESVGLMESGEESVTLTELMIDSESTSAERVRRFREKNQDTKALQCNTDVTECNKSVTQEKEKEIEIDKDIKEKTNKREKPEDFQPPTLEEVREYVRETDSHVDLEEWFNFYASKGWMIGSNKMTDWKASVRSWSKKKTTKPKNRGEPAGREYSNSDYMELEAQLLGRM